MLVCDGRPVLTADGYAPFMSMSRRNTFLTPPDSVVAAPGPGQYDPELPKHTVKVGIQSRSRLVMSDKAFLGPDWKHTGYHEMHRIGFGCLKTMHGLFVFVMWPISCQFPSFGHYTVPSQPNKHCRVGVCWRTSHVGLIRGSSWETCRAQAPTRCTARGTGRRRGAESLPLLPTQTPAR